MIRKPGVDEKLRQPLLTTPKGEFDLFGGPGDAADLVYQVSMEGDRTLLTAVYLFPGPKPLTQNAQQKSLRPCGRPWQPRRTTPSRADRSYWSFDDEECQVQYTCD